MWLKIVRQRDRPISQHFRCKQLRNVDLKVGTTASNPNFKSPRLVPFA